MPLEDPYKVFMDGNNRPYITKKEHVEPVKTAGMPNRLKPQPYKHVHIDVLDLSVTEELQYYQKIWQAVGCGVAAVSAEDRKWIPETNNWKVLIRWVILATMDPSELRVEKTSAVAEALEKVQGVDNAH